MATMLNCSKCYTKKAADGSWMEIVSCALHSEPTPAKKHYRVTWTEKYEKVFEAESEESAIENRDDRDAFLGCEECTAVEVKQGPGGWEVVVPDPDAVPF